jgi:hypothetical protein
MYGPKRDEVGEGWRKYMMKGSITITFDALSL